MAEWAPFPTAVKTDAAVFLILVPTASILSQVPKAQKAGSTSETKIGPILNGSAPRPRRLLVKPPGESQIASL